MKYTERPEYKFFKALKNGNVEFAKELIEQGYDIYQVTESEQWTYLHKMFTSPSFDIKDSLILSSIQFLLKKGLDVNAKDSYGNTPLLYAVRQRNVEGIRLLLENGADKLIEHENLEGVSALRMGFDSMPLNYEVFDLLLQFGADPDVKKDGWKTARQMLTVIAALKQQKALSFLRPSYDIDIALRQKGKNRIDKCTWVFVTGLSTHGKSVNCGYIGNVGINRLWHNSIKRSGIRSRNPYQTRHTYACWMLSHGVNPAFIASQMGHKDMTMVLKVYGTWMQSGNESEIEKMKSALKQLCPISVPFQSHLKK